MLVRAAGTLVLLLCLSSSARAQPAAPSVPPPAEPFKIADNSFLVEEAFNQPAGVFQNIFNAARNDGVWAGTFTQEWPVVSQAHQFSYTLAFTHGDTSSAFGNTLLNYRYQAVMEGPGRRRFAARHSFAPRERCAGRPILGCR